jgi:hypothetical protein
MNIGMLADNSDECDVVEVAKQISASNQLMSFRRSFFWDSNVSILRNKYGNDGFAFYFLLLSLMCYHPEYEISVSEYLVETISRRVGIDKEKFYEMLHTCLEYEMFDSDIYRHEKILVSREFESDDVSFL